VSTMVVETSETTGGLPGGNFGEEDISKSKRGTSWRTQMGNPFHRCSRLMGADLARRLRHLEQRGDIPVHIRLQWLSEHEHKVVTRQDS
jgi:hypothetical protein